MIPQKVEIFVLYSVPLASITSHIHNWVLFLVWLHPFILPGVISPLISSSILGTYWPGECLFYYAIILPFHTVHGVLKARILKWFAIPFSSGPHSVRCQYCIGTGNGRSMNQGKLEVVKQEMARVNVNFLGIKELKWTGMGEFNSDDHYIYYCGQESLRRNGVTIIVKKRVWNAVLGCNLNKKTRMISVRFQGKPFNIMVIQAYAPTSNTEEAEVERFYEDLQDLLELMPPKMSFSL